MAFPPSVESRIASGGKIFNSENGVPRLRRRTGVMPCRCAEIHSGVPLLLVVPVPPIAALETVTIKSAPQGLN